MPATPAKFLTAPREPREGDSRFCRNCRACCCWPGAVLFEPADLPAIAAALGLDERECAEQYFQISRDRRHLRAVERPDGSCAFLGEEGCRIYSLRPRACREFPYLWQRPETELMRQCRLWRALLWKA